MSTGSALLGVTAAGLAWAVGIKHQAACPDFETSRCAGASRTKSSFRVLPAHLVNGLVGTRVPQLCRTVARNQQQRHAALGGLHDAGQQVGDSGAARRDDHRGAAGGTAVAQRPEAQGPLICGIAEGCAGWDRKYFLVPGGRLGACRQTREGCRHMPHDTGAAASG